MVSDPEVLNELTKGKPMHRIELITGGEQRRNRSHDEKTSIVAESRVSGAVIAEVARRHGLSPQQLCSWRSAFRANVLNQVDPTYSAIVVEDELTAAVQRDGRTTCTESPHNNVASSIELTIGEARVIVRGSVDQRTLSTILKALKGLTRLFRKVVCVYWPRPGRWTSAKVSMGLPHWYRSI